MARSSVEEAAPRPTGTLRIGVPSSFGRRYMMPVIAEYVRNYPEVRVDIRFSERFVNLVEEGIELALRIGNLEASTLVARRLGTVQRYLVATPTYLHGRPMPRTPEDLGAHQCIVYSRDVAGRIEWTFESEHGRHVASISGPILVDDADAMQEATMQHLGIAILPEWNARTVFAAASSKTCFRSIRLPRCRCMRSIRRRTGCRCGHEAFWICWSSAPTALPRKRSDDRAIQRSP